MSVAAQPDRRKRRMTAREAAERFGVSARTIRYVVAEERTEYVGRHAQVDVLPPFAGG